jgi:hypothetical protein
MIDARPVSGIPASLVYLLDLRDESLNRDVNEADCGKAGGMHISEEGL